MGRQFLRILGGLLAFWQAFNLVSGLLKPDLVYEISTIESPILLEGVRISYLVKTFTFENVGSKSATNVRAEVSIGSTPSETLEIEMAKDAVFQKIPDGIAMKKQASMSYWWGGIFNIGLERYQSVAEFRNSGKEGNGIVTLENREVLLSHIKNMHPGQTGEIRIGSFIGDPKVTDFKFESNEILGKIKEKDKFFSSQIFYRILVIFLGFLVALGSWPWKKS